MRNDRNFYGWSGQSDLACPLIPKRYWVRGVPTTLKTVDVGGTEQRQQEKVTIEEKENRHREDPAAAPPAQYGVEGITLGAIIEGLNNTTTKADENIKNTPAPHKLKVRGKVRTRGVDSIPYNRRHGHRKRRAAITSAAQGTTDGGNVERTNEQEQEIRRRAAPLAATPPAAAPLDQLTSFRSSRTVPQSASATLRQMRRKIEKYRSNPRMKRKWRARRKKKRKAKTKKKKREEAQYTTRLHGGSAKGNDASQWILGG